MNGDVCVGGGFIRQKIGEKIRRMAIKEKYKQQRIETRKRQQVERGRKRKIKCNQRRNENKNGADKAAKLESKSSE